MKPYEDLTVGDFAGLDVAQIGDILGSYRDRPPSRREIFEKAMAAAQEAAKELLTQNFTS